jgi:outer membrane protein assembly factor BamB
VIWRYEKALPNVPSPLLYQDVLYMLKEGGIFTSLDPATGKVLKQARLSGALGQYFSSPVAADNKIYVISEDGKAVVLKPGAQWEILSVNDLDDSCYATPAIADNRLYIRTRSTLYCFAKRD